jgi:hypothetical protein
MPYDQFREQLIEISDDENEEEPQILRIEDVMRDL